MIWRVDAKRAALLGLLLALSVTTEVASDDSNTCFTIGGDLHCLRIAADGFAVDRWVAGDNAFRHVSTAKADNVRGRLDYVAVVRHDRIVFQLAAARRTELWQAVVANNVIKAARLFYIEHSPTSAPFALYLLRTDAYLVTDGRSLHVSRGGSMKRVEADVYLSDIAVSHSAVAGATGDGVVTWSVEPDGLRRSVAREYNRNVGRVAAIDGGWVLLTMQGKTVEVLVTDEKLSPKHTVPLPSIDEPWELRQIGDAVAVFANRQRQAWIIKSEGVDRVVWPHSLASGGVAAGGSSSVLWLTDGNSALRPMSRTAEAVMPTSGLRLGRVTVVLAPVWKYAIYVLVVLGLLAALIVVRRTI